MENIDKVEAILREVAKGLGTTVEYLWPVLVKYQWAQGVAALLDCGLALAIMAAAWFVTRKTVATVDEQDTAQVGWFVRVVVSFVVLLIVLIASPQAIVKVLAPEGAAANAIMDKIGGK